MSATYKKLGSNVRKIRKEMGLSQEKLAELTRVDPKSIVAIESGKRNPTLKTINKLAKALGVSAKQLL